MSTTTTSNFPPEYVAYDSGPSVVGVSIAMIPLATLVTIARFWARQKKGIPYDWGDWLILVSLVLVWSVCGLAIAAVYQGGVGRHFSVVLTEGDTYGHGMLCLFLVEYTYGTSLVTIKMAILLMYRKIFPTLFMKRGTIIIGSMVLAWWIAIILVTSFQCRPIQKLWDTKIVGGTCIDQNKFFVGNAIPNICTDVFILVLPVVEVSRLHVRTAQKIGIIVIFLLGGLVVIISSVRLKTMVDMLQQGASADITQIIAMPWIWTTVEPTIGMLCASLPTLQPLLFLVFGRLVSSSKEPSKDISGLVTIGGGSSAQRNLGNRSKPQRDNAAFVHLHENDSDENPLFWPKSYANDRTTTVELSRSDKNSNGESIPMDAIKVQKSTWVEERQQQN